MKIIMVSNDRHFADAWYKTLEKVEPALTSEIQVFRHDDNYLVHLTSHGRQLVVFDRASGNDRSLSALEDICTPAAFNPVIISGPMWKPLTPPLLYAIERGHARFVASDGTPGLLEACRKLAVRTILQNRPERPSPSAWPVYANISQPMERWGDLRSSAPIMHCLFRYLNNVAQTDDSLIFVGEPGVGKTFLAREVHDHSPRRDGPFVSFNVGAIPEAMLESELYGYVRGAFTGANKDKDGLFKSADGGTVFLDEIGELPPHLQVKLLSFQTDHAFYQLGSTKLCRVDVRVIYGTNQDIDNLERSGRWRSDFKSRTCRNVVMVPPLRERREDILRFVDHFLGKRTSGKFRLTVDARQSILDAHWPENLRELDNTLNRAANLVAHEADENGVCTIDRQDLFPELAPRRSAPLPARAACKSQAAPGGSVAEELYEAIRSARDRQKPTPHYKELAREYGQAIVMDVIALAMARTRGKANAAGAHLGFYAPGNKKAAIAFTQWLRDNGTSASALRLRIANRSDEAG